MCKVHSERDSLENVQKFGMKSTKTTKTTKMTEITSANFRAWKSSRKFAFESKCERIIKTVRICKNIASFRMMKRRFLLQISEHACENSLVINTQKERWKRFRISVRSLIARHESWYLRVSDIIDHLEISETQNLKADWSRREDCSTLWVSDQDSDSFLSDFRCE